MSEEELVHILMTNTLGESVLVATLKSASFFYASSVNHSNPKHERSKRFLQEARYCYYFVQSTGLDMLIQRFHLGYDPEQIRGIFNYCVRHS